jgi:spermidine/putrescine transport system ATP-binding protein
MALQTEWSVNGKGAHKGAPSPLPATKSPGSAGTSIGANVNRRQDSGRVAVELRGVTAYYKGVAALSSLDLTIAEGEFFSLLGPSGCGKTTTLNIIGGFAEPDEGDVLIQGRSVRRIPAHRRPVNTVFQSYALFPHMNVGENVGFGPRMAGEPRAKIDRKIKEALALVSLSGLEDRRPGQLSGGQQQRVAVARALVNRPAVLLLDEPLGALDLKLRKQMQIELARIQREVGITFVYVTHDQEEAMTMSDRIAVMSRGAIAQIGTPQEIYEHPASLFVADFIGTSNILLGELVGMQGAVGFVRLDGGTAIRASSHVDLPLSSRVAVVVRPDHMTLSRVETTSADINSMSGRISKVSFLGTHLQLSVRVKSQKELTVVRPLASPAADDAPLDVGAPVIVAWPASRSLCFQEREG